MAEATSLRNRFDHDISWAFQTGISEGDSGRVFLAVCVLLFAVNTALTIVGCGSMSAMGDMPMPGGWMMSMAWMRMPEQTWLGVATPFVGMWVAMMIAMMLPSLAPILWRYRRSVEWMGQKRLDYLTMLVALGYFLVWSTLGIAVFAAGATLATFEMQKPAIAAVVPFAGRVVVLIAGILQLTPWKAGQLGCCRELPRHGSPLPVDSHSALREGLHLGVHCSLCCAGLTAVLLVSGIMNLGVMALIGAAIILERVVPAYRRVAQLIGAVMIAAALVLIGRTVAGA